VEVFEDSGETITAPTENKTVLVWQKTDQVGTDGGATISIEYLTAAGVIKSVAVTLDGTATTTEVAVCADFYRLRKMTASLLVADEVILGLTGGAAEYGVIKVSCWEAVQSRYTPPASGKAVLVSVEAWGPHATELSTYYVYAYTKDTTLQRIHSRADIALNYWRGDTLMWEIEPLKDLIFNIKKNADSNHGTLVLRYTVIEAY
jgi:hypothetical protein